MDKLNIHYTLTHRITTPHSSGWEFSCQQCSYRIRYTRLPGKDKLALEIINIGDPSARHTNNTPDWFQDNPIANSTEEEGSWLTAELRDQIRIILSKSGWD